MSDKQMLSVQRDSVRELWVMLCNDAAVEEGSVYGDIREELRALLGPTRYQVLFPTRYQVLFPARGGVPAGYRICTKDAAGQWSREGLPMLTPDPSRVKELDHPTTLNRMGKVKL